MRAIRDKGGKERDIVTEDVGDSFDDSVRLLKLVQCVALARVDYDHVVDVPEYLLDKICRRCSGMISDALRGAIQT